MALGPWPLALGPDLDFNLHLDLVYDIRIGLAR